MTSHVIFAFGICMALNIMAVTSSDAGTYFPEINGNLSKITWAHAVNDLALLTSTLNDSNIMMIEADVVMGTVNGAIPVTPIMAHPPLTVSDLSLEMFLTAVNKANNSTNTTNIKGIKLDFKSIVAFNASVEILSKNYPGTYPLWLNADILEGPINATTTPVDAAQFIAGARNFSTAVLSLGWTTNYPNNTNGTYTDDQIKAMLTVVQDNNVTQEVTFAVRAGLAAGSLTQMTDLLAGVDKSTLTIWSSEGDAIDIESLRTVIGKVGLKKSYIDVPDDVEAKLRLNDISSGSYNTALMSTVVVTTVLALFL